MTTSIMVFSRSFLHHRKYTTYISRTGTSVTFRTKKVELKLTTSIAKHSIYSTMATQQTGGGTAVFKAIGRRLSTSMGFGHGANDDEADVDYDYNNDNNHQRQENTNEKKKEAGFKESGNIGFVDGSNGCDASVDYTYNDDDQQQQHQEQQQQHSTNEKKEGVLRTFGRRLSTTMGFGGGGADNTDDEDQHDSAERRTKGSSGSSPLSPSSSDSESSEFSNTSDDDVDDDDIDDGEEDEAGGKATNGERTDVHEITTGSFEDDDDDDESSPKSSMVGETSISKTFPANHRSAKIWRLFVICSFFISGVFVTTLLPILKRYQAQEQDPLKLRSPDGESSQHIPSNNINNNATSPFSHESEKSAQEIVLQLVQNKWIFQMETLLEVSKSFGKQIATVSTSPSSFSTATTRSLINSKKDFPFVSIPSYEVYASKARLEGMIESIVYAPIVQTTIPTTSTVLADDNYSKWLSFTNHTKEWLDESYGIFKALVPESNRLQAQGYVKRSFLPPVIYRFDSSGMKVPWFLEQLQYQVQQPQDDASTSTENNTIQFCPRLYTSPPPLLGDGIVQNEDLFSLQEYKAITIAANKRGDIVFSTFLARPGNTDSDTSDVDSRLTSIEWDPIGDLREVENNLDITGSNTDNSTNPNSNSINSQNGDGDNIFSNDSASAASTVTPDTTTTTTSSNDTYHFFGSPHSLLAVPVYSTVSKHQNLGSNARNGSANDSDRPVAYLFNIIAWAKYLPQSIPHCATGTIVLIHNTCGESITYGAKNGKFVFVPDGGMDYVEKVGPKHSISIAKYRDELAPIPGACQYSLDVYPTNSCLTEKHQSDGHLILFIIIVILFVAMIVSFYMYDQKVQDRSIKVGTAAARSEALVSSFFPSNVRARLLAGQNDNDDDSKHNNKLSGYSTHTSNKKNQRKTDQSKSSLKGFLAGETNQDTEMKDTDVYKSKPIADLFLETTVMFGDIVGFTAWSSVREPTQVFTLLETIYHAFDEIARKRRVFKVETVGDCYVAVCGLPDPRKDHAVVMCRFARDCMYKMWALTKALEVVLGPDTGELSMRVGLHSGPVTAGVLRGERSRFQLFGDTMNTAARMESNGKKSRIQLSQETADLLISAGKQSWLIAREDKIIAKGKGELQTYWLDRSDKGETIIHGSEINTDVAKDNLDTADVVIAHKSSADPAKTERLIDWTVEVLVRLLKQVVGRRRSNGRELFRMEGSVELILKPARGQTVLDEVKEIITLPKFDATVNTKKEAEVELGPRVVEQLHDYVWNVASMYRNNPFHNFEHASHVSMSVIKLLSRIVAPSENDIAGEVKDASSLHDHTYGITSDPLTQFSCVLSALIHDMDHPGVPNAQLVKENSQLASVYKGKSVAEQNSVDIAWHLLMDERYVDLRGAIYVDDIEMRRFRQLVVNSVMATDIVDKELKNLRNARWDKAFSDINHEEDAQVSINRKATIVIEHLIQASDVAHTMQHWHIYRKWNERFFMECYKAYKDGRADTDPSINWYQGEIGFFDFYIIPLAKKLKNCGVFGVSSDEYLNYAVQNRQEWEQRGQEDVAKMVQNVDSMWTETS